MIQEINEPFTWSKPYQLITHDMHHVPGLYNFAYRNFKEASTPYQLHYHSNIFEIHCFTRGRRFCQIEDEGVIHNYVVNGGQAFVTYPAQIHGNGTAMLDPYEYYALQISIEDPDHLLGLNQQHSNALYQALLDLQNTGAHKFALEESHLNMLRTAFRLFSEFKEESAIIGVQYLSCFLFSFRFLQAVSGDADIDPNIDNAIRYISEHIAGSPSIEEVAACSGYSESHFKMKFKKATGIPPAEYINLKRIEYSKWLLSHTNQSISDIGNRLNFSTSSYFCSSFKKYTGYTPKEYRKKESRMATQPWE